MALGGNLRVVNALQPTPALLGTNSALRRSMKKGEYKGPPMTDLKDYFLKEAAKTNHYEQGPEVKGHSCHSCVRKRYSYPDTCNDGWPMGNSEWKNRGATCRNWVTR
jgi:hypothetical protein